LFYGKEVTQEMKDKVVDSMSTLDLFVAESLWFAGDKPTIADLTILANVTQIQACGYNISPHVNLSKWLERCKQFPGFEENQNAADNVGKLFKAKVPKLF
jgi:glutathione S-transferase